MRKLRHWIETHYAQLSYGKLKSAKWERSPKISIYYDNTVLRDLLLCEYNSYCRVSCISSSEFTTDGPCIFPTGF